MEREYCCDDIAVDTQRFGHGVDACRRVRPEHTLVDGPRQEGVVDSVHDVADGVVLGEHRLVDHRSRIARSLEYDLDPRLLGESFEGPLAEGERVMGDEHEPFGIGRRRATADQHGECGGGADQHHDSAVGTASVRRA